MKITDKFRQEIKEGDVVLTGAGLGHLRRGIITKIDKRINRWDKKTEYYCVRVKTVCGIKLRYKFNEPQKKYDKIPYVSIGSTTKEVDSDGVCGELVLVTAPHDVVFPEFKLLTRKGILCFKLK